MLDLNLHATKLRRAAAALPAITAHSFCCASQDVAA